MVRRVELGLIQDELSKQLSFAKRRNGMVKKALELYMVCNVDCLFISFSPSGRLSYFCGNRRVEEVVARFLSFSDDFRRVFLSDEELPELLHILRVLRDQTQEHIQNDRHFAGVQQEIDRVREEIDNVKLSLRKWFPTSESIMTIEEANLATTNIQEALARVRETKRQLEPEPEPEPENGAFQLSNSMNGNLSNDAQQQVQPDRSPHENSNRNQNQVLNQSPDAENGVISSDSSPSQSRPLGRVASPGPRISGAPYTSLLLATNGVAPFSPRRAPGVPLIRSPQAAEQNNNGSIGHDQNSFFQDLMIDTNQFFNNPATTEAIQATEQNGNTYGTANVYINPNSDLSYSTDYQLPSTFASFQAPYNQMPFQLQSSNAIATPGQSPYYQSQMSFGASSSNASQWMNQSIMQPQQDLFGQSSGFQSLMNSISGDMYHPENANLSALPTNMQMHHQAGGCLRMGSSLAIPPLPNSTQHGPQVNQMSAMPGQFKRAGSLPISHKRKFPLEEEDEIVPRLANSENMTAPDYLYPPSRTSTNDVYDPAFQSMGLAIDPHFRMFKDAHMDGEVEDNIVDKQQEDQ